MVKVIVKGFVVGQNGLSLNKLALVSFMREAIRGGPQHEPRKVSMMLCTNADQHRSVSSRMINPRFKPSSL